MDVYRIEHYLTYADQQNPYLNWLRNLRDGQAKIAIVRRVIRVQLGNFGDRKLCRDGVWELRVDVGAGYRIYYSLPANRTVLLLCGGDKRKQDVDIARAVHYWRDWKRRVDDEKQIP